MRLQQLRWIKWGIKLCLAGLAILPVSAVHPGNQPPPPAVELSTEPVSQDPEQLECSFNDKQIELLEKLNRSDRGNLVRLKRIVVPDRWDLDELTYSSLPIAYRQAQRFSKALVV